jgi:hypothetical protein
MTMMTLKTSLFAAATPGLILVGADATDTLIGCVMSDGSIMFV